MERYLRNRNFCSLFYKNNKVIVFNLIGSFSLCSAQQIHAVDSIETKINHDLALKKNLYSQNSENLPVPPINDASVPPTNDAPAAPEINLAPSSATEPATPPAAKSPQQSAINKPDPTDEVAGGLKKPKHSPPKYAVLPTGKTLPQGIFRIDVPLAYTFGKKGYDNGGNEVENGFNFKRTMTGLIVQYGLNDRVSIGLGVPIVAANNMSVDGEKLAQNSNIYKKYYNKAIDQLAEYLSNAGVGCGTVPQCKTAIENDTVNAPPGNQRLVLPSGEVVTLQSTHLAAQIHNIIVRSSTPAPGNAGMGDVQLGILVSVINERSPILNVPLYLSVGGGLRFPTGKFNTPMAFRQTGGDGMLLTPGGTLDLILRWNLDYELTPGVYLSWQSQVEHSMTKAILNRSSLVDPKRFNNADPTYGVDIYNHGDGVDNQMELSRKGLRTYGFLQGAWGLGNVYKPLKHLGLYGQAKYNVAEITYLNGQPIQAYPDQLYLNDSKLHQKASREQFYSTVVGVKVSGLPSMIPLEVTLEYEHLFYGRNLVVAPGNIMAALHVYF